MPVPEKNPPDGKTLAKPVNPYQSPEVPGDFFGGVYSGPETPHRGTEHLRSGLIAAGLFYLPTPVSMAAVNLLNFPPEPFMFVVPALGLTSFVLALIVLQRGRQDLRLMREGKMDVTGKNPTTNGIMLSCLVLAPVLGVLGLFLALIAICLVFPPNFHGP